MKKSTCLIAATVTLLFFFEKSKAQDKDTSKIDWLKQAKQLLPVLSHHTSYPINSIKIEKDVTEWLGWKATSISPEIKLTSIRLGIGDTIMLDFGRNMVGYLQGISSASATLKIQTAEVLAELGDSWEQYPPFFDNGYKPSNNWIFDIDIKSKWRVKERRTFRYIRIVVLKADNTITLSNLQCDEVSAIAFNKIKPLIGFSKQMQQIDLTAQYTLRNCIQEVFEDGPKRDQRLWLGDLRLEALADGVLYKSDSLVKRSLLLFAGKQRADGFIPSCVFTENGLNPEIGDEMIPDYAMLFGSVLLNYSSQSNDWALAKKLYPLASRQVNLVCEKWLNRNHYLEIPKDIWMLIDWSKDLDRQTSEQATAIYSIKTLLTLVRKLGIREDIEKWENLSTKMQASALLNFFDKEKGLFISGPQMQVSWASQIWMILAGVIDKKKGAQILTTIKAYPGAIKPGTAYLMHHLVQAYLICDMDEEAYNLIKNYWGGMVDKGADTFWEIYNPENPYTSPYNSHLYNSYCHAWSCTPAWFLRHPVYGKRLRKIDSNKIYRQN
jgi:hypothetical protein